MDIWQLLVGERGREENGLETGGLDPGCYACFWVGVVEIVGLEGGGVEDVGADREGGEGERGGESIECVGCAVGEVVG